MKKSLLSIMGVAVTAMAFGQNVAPSPKNPVEKQFNTVKTVAPTPTSNRAGSNGTAALGANLFIETFGAGLAGDGTNGAWTTNGNSNSTADPDAVWEYRGTATTPSNATGSRGAYAGSGAPVASPTTANGFFIFDSDYLDNGGTPGAFGSGDAPTPHESWLISPVFSTVGSNDIIINMTTYFRRFYGDGYVLLSNDGGATWGDSVAVFDTDFGVNVASATDELVNQKVNFIANSANARIALYFDGISNTDGYYFFMVDDIVIAEAPDNNLAYEGTFLQNNFDTGFTAYYSRIPLSQADYDTISFGAKFSNQGAVIQPNTKVENNFINPTGTGVLSSTPAPSNPGTSDSAGVNGTIVLDQGLGMYSWSMSVSSDSTDDVPANNADDTIFVSVTDSTYGRDYQAGGNSWYGAGSTFEIGPSFDIYDSVKATSVTLFVGASSTAGEIISVYLYDGNLDQPVSKQEFITLTQGDIDNGMTVAIPQVVLEPGTYIATYRTYSDEVYFRRSTRDADPQTVFVQVDADGTWYYTAAIPAVRLNVSEDLFICDVTATPYQTANNTANAGVMGGTSPYAFDWSDGQTTEVATGLTSGNTYTVTITDDNGCVSNAGTVDIVSSVAEANLENAVKVFPNPNNGDFTLQLAGLNGSYSVTVLNIAGQTISVETVNVTGRLNKTFSTGLSKGMYLIEVSDAAGAKVVKQFIVE